MANQRPAPVIGDETSELRLAVARRAELPANVTGEAAFAAVMCALSRRLSGGEARALLLSLPESVRGLVDRCVLHRDEESSVFSAEQMVEDVQAHLDCDPDLAEVVVGAVFFATKRLLSDEIIHDVRSQLPSDLGDLWTRA
jgi:uncharacterized protein (DUF2267 family)